MIPTSLYNRICGGIKPPDASESTFAKNQYYQKSPSVSSSLSNSVNSLDFENPEKKITTDEHHCKSNRSSSNQLESKGGKFLLPPNAEEIVQFPIKSTPICIRRVSRVSRAAEFLDLAMESREMNHTVSKGNVESRSTFREIQNSSDTANVNDRVVRRQVYICVVFLKIGEIDTIKEQYAADVLIKAKWREPDLDHRHDHSGKLEYDWSSSWTPKLYIENTIGEAKEHVYQMITFNEFGHAFLFEKRRVSGIFLENLELNHFPFDVQDLTITVASNLATTEIRLVNDPDESHRINKQSFVDEQEWFLYKHIETEQRELAYEYADPASIRPALSVKCRAARRPAYFIWNIFLVTFLICSLSLVTFAVSRKLPQNRLQLTFTLVLTLVAFKFVVNQCLPKISYLTYLDKYVISSLFILTVVCLWHGFIVIVDKTVDPESSVDFEIDGVDQKNHHATVKQINITDPSSKGSTYEIISSKHVSTKDSKIMDRLELYAISVMAISYVFYNVGFIIMIYKVACKRRREMKTKDKSYMEKIACQMRSKGMRAKKMMMQTHQLHEVKENGQSSATFI